MLKFPTFKNFIFLAMLSGVWDLKFLHQGLNPCPLQWKCSLNHWTVREVPHLLFVYFPDSVFLKDACSVLLKVILVLKFLGLGFEEQACEILADIACVL